MFFLDVAVDFQLLIVAIVIASYGKRELRGLDSLVKVDQ